MQVPPAEGERTFPQADATDPPSNFDHMKHIKDSVTAHKAFNFKETDREAILRILGNCARVQPDLYISPNNAATVFTMLKNVTTCFDTSRSDIKRYRRCNVLLGMKNSGKSVLVSVLREAIQEQYPKSTR